MVSSLMMGLALGVGGVLSPVIGSLADRYSLPVVLAWLPLVPLLTALLCMRLPENVQPAFEARKSTQEAP
jgi:FSR family fosmidomycin resistance protein-like MFS transporter